MRVQWLVVPLVLAVLGGCFGSNGDDDNGIDPVTPGNVRVFSGLIEFGQNTTDGSGAQVPGAFGTAGYAYVSQYGPEPNIGVTSSGAIFTSAFSTVMRSVDGGATWEGVHTHSGLNNDPMLWVDSWTDRVYNAPMFPTLLCATLYWSDDDGDSWGPPSPACGTGALDHQKLASGPPGPDPNPLAGVLHPTVAYVCYNGVAITNCMASYDGGQTWPVDEPTAVNVAGTLLDLFGTAPPADQVSPCFSGQNGHPTASYDGVVAFLRTWSCREPILTYSTDSGLTWTNVAGPRFPGGPSDFLASANAHSIDPEVAFTPDGTMYVLFQSHDHRAYVARTNDLGATWDGPWDVTPPGVTSTVFAALGAGDNGRIAMGFLGTEGYQGSSTIAPTDSRWHLWIVTSEDAQIDDPTFVAYQVTPHDDPVQVGPILQGGGTDNTRNLLDFIDGAVAPDGSFYVSFTAGCTPFNDCTDLPPEEQTDAYRGSAGAVGWVKGWSLLNEPRTGPIPL